MRIALRPSAGCTGRAKDAAAFELAGQRGLHVARRVAPTNIAQGSRPKSWTKFKLHLGLGMLVGRNAGTSHAIRAILVRFTLLPGGRSWSRKAWTAAAPSGTGMCATSPLTSESGERTRPSTQVA